uniref:Leucine carboxyl methyltransferase 1 n=1 Tax=Trepomonas sp. PC1 TaxID=1076344 RepID=A0A146KF80_9EUKA|eukprot:JAP95137.1 Leucine carboxyl methyltransferase [Trepomonas sp. PC1]
MSNKETATETAYDAIASKASAWKAGYFDDPKFHLVSKPHPQKKDPMINRGTWFRIELFKRLCQDFLDKNLNCQVLILGGGLDTLYYRLKSQPSQKFIEVDLPQMVQLKMKKLAGKQISQNIYQIEENYHLYGQDLEEEFLERIKIDFATPTIIISDVVLSYLESDFTIALFDQIKQHFTSEILQFVGFEMVNPHDPFGDQMVFNMSQREIFMPTFAEIGFIESYRRQLRKFTDKTVVKKAWGVYNSFEGRKEMEKLEFLDEYEQFQMIMEHYAVIVGCKGCDVAGIGEYDKETEEQIDYTNSWKDDHFI